MQQRPEGLRLLEDAKKGLFDTLLLYKLDRLGRDTRVTLNAVYELERLKIKVKSMTEPFDTADPSGRFMLTIMDGVANLERDTILERMWLGANRCAREGKWLGGIVPFGYVVDDEGFLAINNTPIPGFQMSEADIVRMIYRMTVEEHLSTIAIATRLNAMGLPPKYAIDGRTVSRGKRKMNTSGKWLPGRIRNMIVSATYKGYHQYGNRSKRQREVIPAPCRPL